MAYDRERANRNARDVARDWAPGPGSEATLGKVTTANASIGVGKFLRWHPVTLTGAQTEGAAPTLTVDTTVTLDGELVQGAAAQDDILLFRWADYHWVTDGKPSADCDPATTKVNVTVHGCNGATVAGATVDVTLGGLPYASATTDGAGVASIGLSKKGTYAISASAATFDTTSTTAVTVTTCGTVQTRDITLTVPAGRICCGSRTYPTTLYLTTSAGTATLTYDSFQGGWYGELTATATAWQGKQCFGQWYLTCGDTPASRAVAVGFLITCAFHVRMYWPGGGAPASSTCFDATCTNSGNIGSCLPVSGPGAGGGLSGTTDFSGGTDPVLPQTATLATADDLYGCPSPLTGSAILDE